MLGEGEEGRWVCEGRELREVGGWQDRLGQLPSTSSLEPEEVGGGGVEDGVAGGRSLVGSPSPSALDLLPRPPILRCVPQPL